MDTTRNIFETVKKKILLLLCVLAAFVIILPFSTKDTYAATTRYVDAIFDFGGTQAKVTCRIGDSPHAWISGANYSIKISANGKETNNSNGINAATHSGNWKYVTCTMTIPKGYYFKAGSTTNNFGEDSNSATIQTKNPTYGNLELPTERNTNDRTVSFNIYWNNRHTDVSTSKFVSWKKWTFTRDYYALDVNGFINGADVGWITNYGTFDMYVNGVLVANDVADYYQNLGYGDTYSIGDIRAASGQHYDGVHAGALSGTITEPMTVSLQYRSYYTVNFCDADGNAYQSKSVLYGDASPGPSYNPSKTGHTFAGWDKAYNRITSNLNVYPTWTVNSYYLDVNGRLDGSNVGNTSGYGTFDVYVNNQLVANDVTDYYNAITYGSTYSITDIRSTTGHTYEGVYSGDVSGTMGAGDRSVYLQFSTNKYTYTFVYGNGSSNSTGTKTYGVPYKLPSAPTRTGYKFLNWKSGTSNATYAAGASCSEEGNRTFTAQWQALDYYIRYNGNGAEKGSMDTVKTTVSVEKTLDLCKFGRAGYTFLGWSKSANATTATYTDEAKVKDLTTTGNATVDLYAVWKKEASPEINMFTGCFKVSGEAGTKYDRRYVNHKRANIDKASDPGYFTKK